MKKTRKRKCRCDDVNGGKCVCDICQKIKPMKKNRKVKFKDFTTKDASRMIGLLIGYVNWTTGAKLMVVDNTVGKDRSDHEKD